MSWLTCYEFGLEFPIHGDYIFCQISFAFIPKQFWVEDVCFPFPISSYDYEINCSSEKLIFQLLIAYPCSDVILLGFLVYVEVKF